MIHCRFSWFGPPRLVGMHPRQDSSTPRRFLLAAVPKRLRDGARSGGASPRRLFFELGACALVGLVVFLLLCSGIYDASAQPIQLKSGYVPLDPDSAYFEYPHVGSGDHSYPWPSGLAERLFIGLGNGSTASRLDAAGAAAGAAAAMLMTLVVRRLGYGWLPGIIGGLAVMSSGVVWRHAVVVTPHSLLPPLFLGVLLGLLYLADRRRPVTPWLGSGLFALGVASYPAVLALLPGVVGSVFVSDDAPSLKRKHVALFVLAAAVGLAGWRTAFGQALEPVVQAGGLAGVLALQPLLAVVERLGPTIQTIVDELGLLGIALVLAGIGRLLQLDDRRSAVLLIGTCVTSIAWALVAASGDLTVTLIPALLTAWLIVAAGMSWLSAVVTGRGPKTIAIGLMISLPMLGVLTDREWARWAKLRQSSASRFADAVIEVLPDRAAVVAESGLLESAVQRANRIAGRPELLRLRPDPEELKRYRQDGYAVYALGDERTDLARFGLLLVDVPLRVPRIPLRVYLDSIPRRFLVAAAISPALTSDVESERAPLFSVIGGVLKPLESARSFYGIVGAKGRRGAVIEELQADGVDLRVTAGDVIGNSILRAPVSVQVASDDRGARIMASGESVVESATGVVVAVIAPNGPILETHVTDPGGESGIPAVAGAPALARLHAWEPCVVVESGIWTDVTAAMATGDMSRPTASVVNLPALQLYLGARHPLSPQADRADPFAADALDVEEFSISDPDRVVRLREVLRLDRADAEGDRLIAHPYVYRLQIERGVQRVMAGGFPEVAVARSQSEAVDSPPAAMCAGVPAQQPFFSSDGGGGVNEVPLDVDEFFGYGWHSPSRGDFQPRRWTAATEAELVLPFARVGLTSVQIRARSAVAPTADGPVLSLRVNETTLEPQQMQEGLQAYEWVVPAVTWKIGANRVSLGVSALVRPADVSDSRDDRLLGVSVAMMRFELLDGP